MEKKPQDTESRHADKFIVRFPEGLRARLHEAAKANSRSMNAELVARLQSSFQQHSSVSGEIQAAAYRSHALALESQAMTLQNQLTNLMAQATRLGKPASEEAALLRQQIQMLEKKLTAIDEMTRKLHQRADAAEPQGDQS